jgi:hypothetical protein
VSHQLRRDITSYVAVAARGDSGGRQAAARAEIDCAAIDASVARGFG